MVRGPRAIGPLGSPPVPRPCDHTLDNPTTSQGLRPSCGEAVVSLVEHVGASTVFGIPGVHTLEIYRGLSRSTLRHVGPRHEQGAAFMADGWARVRGEPGV